VDLGALVGSVVSNKHGWFWWVAVLGALAVSIYLLWREIGKMLGGRGGG